MMIFNIKDFSIEKVAKITAAWQWIPLLILASSKDKKLTRDELLSKFNNIVKLAVSKGFPVLLGNLSLEDIIEWYQKNGFVEIKTIKHMSTTSIEIRLDDKDSSKAINYAKELVKNVINLYDTNFANGVRFRELIKDNYPNLEKLLFS